MCVYVNEMVVTSGLWRLYC